MADLYGEEDWRVEFKSLCSQFGDIREDVDQVRLGFFRLPKGIRCAMARTMADLGLVGEPPIVAK